MSSSCFSITLLLLFSRAASEAATVEVSVGLVNDKNRAELDIKTENKWRILEEKREMKVV